MGLKGGYGGCKMTCRVIIYFLALLWVFPLSCKNTNYVEYVPIIVKEKHGRFMFIRKPEIATRKHLRNIKKLLHFYNYSFLETDDGKILIPKNLNEDNELLMNLTKKANDEEFLKKLFQE